MNQHQKDTVDFTIWANTFRNMISTIPRFTIVYLGDPKHPVVATPSTRAWCVWEIFSAIQLGKKLEVTLSVGMMTFAITGRQVRFGIKIEKCDATFAEDKARILRLVASGEGGTERVNTLVSDALNQEFSGILCARYYS